ncbi:NACHT domain-containing protein [Streptomyces sp. YIM 98790]|uniref:NACHT domain-containing protein n=1 Tax=Streptomyces sp. YIM 98790 TaxID=2689077 RepID=UPI00140BA552|nr:NACHT domain-containing protein [Streptomyces sp. YIM 98790]
MAAWPLHAPSDTNSIRESAERLARQVETLEGEQWRRLVGGDRQRINLGYRLHPEAGLSATVPESIGKLFPDEESGVYGIANYFRSITPSRMVITGAPGAGKTVLALELLLALIERREETDPVPIMIPLANWDPHMEALDDLIVRQLVDTYRWPKHTARELVEHHLILPVLDGLDEMDPTVKGTETQAPFEHRTHRARAAVKALNGYGIGRAAGALVLTCRSQAYHALADNRLREAAHIKISPVEIPDAKSYLAERCGNRERIREFTGYLELHPETLLARAISTP